MKSILVTIGFGVIVCFAFPIKAEARGNKELLYQPAPETNKVESSRMNYNERNLKAINNTAQSNHDENERREEEHHEDEGHGEKHHEKDGEHNNEEHHEEHREEHREEHHEEHHDATAPRGDVSGKPGYRERLKKKKWF